MKSIKSEADLGREISEVLVRALRGFRCPGCGSPLGHPVDVDQDTKGIVCDICGDETQLMAPVYLGESHDHQVGVIIYEQTGSVGAPPIEHYIGCVPLKGWRG